jgi:antitoxin component of MazEF toxin-antitoxin module
MKLKVSGWGNSHGVRLSGAMMEHLNIQAGDEVDVRLTNNGVEIVKSGYTLDFLSLVAQEVTDSLLAQTSAVSEVDDPYREGSVAYVVIGVNPCAPLIREVPKGTEGSYPTLADAKEAARQKLQSSIAEAQKSLAELRQVGIGNIAYISL